VGALCGGRHTMAMSAHTWDDFQPVGLRSNVVDHVAMQDGRAMAKKQPLPEVLTPRTSKRMNVTPKHVMQPVGELTYFPVRGRAEPLRFILYYSGLAYTEHVVQPSDWPQLKPTTPNGLLPVFTSCDGEQICETLTIAQHLAGLSDVPGLLPADATAAAGAASLFAACFESPFIDLMPLTNMTLAAEAESELSGCVDKCVQALAGWTPQLQASAAFFGGAAPHYGDFGVLYAVEMLRTADSAIVEQLGSCWESWYAAMRALPGIDRYLQCRAKAMGGEIGFPGSRIATLPLDD